MSITTVSEELNKLAEDCVAQPIAWVIQYLQENGWKLRQKAFSAIILTKGSWAIRMNRPVGAKIPADYVRRVEGSAYLSGRRIAGLWALPSTDWQWGNGFFVRSSAEYESHLLDQTQN